MTVEKIISKKKKKKWLEELKTEKKKQKFETLRQPASGVLNNVGKKERRRLFPLVPMGVLATGSAHARASARPPIDTVLNVLNVTAEKIISKKKKKWLEEPQTEKKKQELLAKGERWLRCTACVERRL